MMMMMVIITMMMMIITMMMVIYIATVKNDHDDIDEDISSIITVSNSGFTLVKDNNYLVCTLDHPTRV